MDKSQLLGVISTILLGGYNTIVVIIITLSLLAPLVRSGGSFQMIYDGPEPDNWSKETHHDHSFSQPQFIYKDSVNVSAILGKQATLNCRVRAVANRTVRINLHCINILL